MSRVMNRVVAFCLFLLAVPALARVRQVSLPSVTLNVAGKAVTAEVADEPHERRTGLMFRDAMAADSGMLFVMPKPEHTPHSG